MAQHRSRNIEGSLLATLRPVSAPREIRVSFAPRQMVKDSPAPIAPRRSIVFTTPATVTVDDYLASADKKFDALVATFQNKPTPKPTSAPIALATPAAKGAAPIANLFNYGPRGEGGGGGGGGNGGSESGDGDNGKKKGDPDGKKHEIGELEQQETGVTCWAAVAKHLLKELANIFVPEEKVVEAGTGSTAATTGDDQTTRKALSNWGVESQKVEGGADIRGRYGGQMDKVDIAMFGYVPGHVTYLKRFNPDGSFVYLDPQSPGEHTGNDLHADFYVVGQVKQN